jgi:3-isopropylmalate/(R)-2-methylmalate dehydratase large subunit
LGLREVFPFNGEIHMGRTIAQKILKSASGDPHVAPGDILIAEVSALMISEALGPKFFKADFDRLGGSVFDSEKIVGVIDHYSPAATIAQADLNRFARQWFSQTGIRHLYENCGPNPQVMAEKGFFQPGSLVVGNDSHTCTGGAFGALAFGVGTTSIACAAATGRIWVRVPETVKVTWRGNLPEHVYGKDMALFMIGQFGATRMIYKAIEFKGPGIARLSMDDRMVICNMAVEMGAKAGIIAPDEITCAAVAERKVLGVWDIDSDPDADFEEEIVFDADALEPMIAAPHHVDNVQPVTSFAGTKIDQAFIGSCTGGRYQDLTAALDVLKGRKVHPSVRLIVNPASKWIWEKASRAGILEALSRAGAVISYPSCGPCGGAQGGLIGSGEVCLAATNRNFKGRMGSTESRVYLASPATVAVSAVHGCISDPRKA